MPTPLLQLTYNAAAPITANTAPAQGYINRYDATAGNLAITLPALSGVDDGANFIVEKYSADVSANTITFTAAGSDTFDDATTTLVLRYADEKRSVQVITVSGTKYWKVTQSSPPATSAAFVVVGRATTATAAGTTTLTSGSAAFQQFTGSTTQNCVLPDATTMTQGQAFTVANRSTGAVTVKKNGGSTLQILAGGTEAVFTLITNTPAAGVWDTQYLGLAATSGKSLSASNSLTLAGTDGTTMTFPSTSATVARTDAANTFTGHQTIEGVTSTGATGTGKLVFDTGSSLEGCTIGGTTVAPAVNALAMKSNSLAATNGIVTLSGSTPKPFINHTVAVTGTLSTAGAANLIGLTDGLQCGTNWFYGLEVLDTVAASAVGLRNAIYGFVNVTSVGTNTQTQAQYVGVQGRANLATSLGGDAGTPIGQAWGGWFSAGASAGTYLANVIGVEIDLGVAAGCSIQGKAGLAIGLSDSDAVRGSVVDCAIGIVRQETVSNTFKLGICFGSDIGSLNIPDTSYVSWPFASDSTLIYAAGHGAGTNNAAIGIDFSSVTFAGAAIKVGAASISLSDMASAPTAAAGEGRLYVASDGSLHYAGPTTDTEIAPA
jgi:hypothetical protein